MERSGKLEDTFNNAQLQLHRLKIGAEGCNVTSEASERDRLCKAKEGLNKRMLHDRMEVEYTKRRLARILQEQESRVNASVSDENRRQHLLNMLADIKRTEAIESGIVLEDIIGLQRRFDLLRGQMSTVVDLPPQKMENFDTTGNSNGDPHIRIRLLERNIRTMQMEMDQLRQSAASHRRDAQGLRANLMNTTRRLTNEITPDGFRMVQNEVFQNLENQKNELEQRLAVLQRDKETLTNELRQKTTAAETHIASMRDHVKMPRSFIDPISHVVITDPLCDRSGYCFDRTTINELFWGNDNPVHPLTRAPITRDDFIEVPNWKGVVDELVPETTPSNTQCPITKLHIKDPVCDINGDCFEKEALENLFRASEAQGIPALHPDTHGVITPDQFRRNSRWSETVVQFARHIEDVAAERDRLRNALSSSKTQAEETIKELIDENTRQGARINQLNGELRECEQIKVAFHELMTNATMCQAELVHKSARIHHLGGLLNKAREHNSVLTTETNAEMEKKIRKINTLSANLGRYGSTTSRPDNLTSQLIEDAATGVDGLYIQPPPPVASIQPTTSRPSKRRQPPSDTGSSTPIRRRQPRAGIDVDYIPRDVTIDVVPSSPARNTRSAVKKK